VHIANGIDMDQEANPGDDEHHPDAEVIHQKTKVDLQIPHRQEVIQYALDRAGRTDLIKAGHRQEKRHQQCAAADEAHGGLGHIFPEQAIDGEPEKGQEGNKW